MPRLIAGLIDVFADSPLRGNPLAVVEGADELSDATLRDIAREFNQAETTFLVKSTRADWRLRSLTANGTEVFGAGHNALGAWLWLGIHGRLGDLTIERKFTQEIGADVWPLTLSLRDGRVHGRMSQGALRLKQPILDLRPLAAALGLQLEELLADPAPRTAGTGGEHLMVRARDRQAVDRCTPAHEALLPVLKAAGAEGCYVYAFESTVPDQAYTRFFNPTVGLWEDAATGTAAGPLAAYLGAEGLLNSDRTLTVEQGVRMGRRSLLKVRLAPNAELSGSGIVVLRGELHL